MLSGLATGARYADLWNSHRGEEVDFYDLKGALENVVESLGEPEVTFVPEYRAVSPSREVSKCSP